MPDQCLLVKYGFAGTPVYMFLAQCYGMEILRRVVCILTHFAVSLYAKVTKGSASWYEDSRYMETNPRLCIATYAFAAFIVASSTYDLYNYLPYLSHSPDFATFSTWSRFVRFALFYMSSNAVRNMFFLLTTMYFHLSMEEDGIEESWAFGNVNFASNFDDVVEAVGNSYVATFIGRIGALCYAVVLLMLCICSLVFYTPATVLFIWMPIAFTLGLFFLRNTFGRLRSSFPVLEILLPAHVVVAFLFWTFFTIMTEMSALYFIDKNYRLSIEHAFSCHASFSRWKSTLPSTGVYGRIFF